MSVQNTKLKFFYDTMLGSTGSALSATSTSSTADFSIDYIHNFLEVNKWQASDTASQNITYDAGVGNTKTADYLAVRGHNLFSADATVVLQYSSDFGSSTNDAFTAAVPAADTVFFQEFTPQTARYWRLKIENSSTNAIYLAISVWGELTELDYIQPSFDPYAQKAKANVNMTQGGFIAGIHTQYTQREISINLHNQSTAIYAKVKTWWETHGMNNFFMAWDSTSSTSDIWLVRPDEKFNNPVNAHHLRDITIKLTGRKE